MMGQSSVRPTAHRRHKLGPLVGATTGDHPQGKCSRNHEGKSYAAHQLSQPSRIKIWWSHGDEYFCRSWVSQIVFHV